MKKQFLILLFIFCHDAFALPEYPSIYRNNELLDSNAELLYPHIPARRTTGDGRLNISMGGIHFFSNQNGVGKGLNLFVPEKITADNILETSPGIHIQAHPQDISLDESELVNSSIVTSKRMQTLCDGTKAALPYFVKTRRNPYLCDEDETMDCYDLTVVSKISNSDFQNPVTEIWGRDIRVKVRDPKTPDAKIFAIEYLGNGTTLGAVLSISSFFEPLVTDDGQLLVGRGSQSMHTWTDHLGTTHNKRYDLLYSKLDSGHLPCDVTGFNDFYPIAFAHHDPNMQDYGLAKYPIRDSVGNIIPHHEDLKVTYPWVDRKGDNIFFTSRYNGYHYFNTQGEMQTRYPKRCYNNSSHCNLEYTESDFISLNVEPSWGYSNFGYFGLWSLGKMVLIDGMINATDYNVRREEQYKWQAKIFESHVSKGDGWLNFGNGRNLGNPGGPGLPTNLVSNFQMFGSHENLFNYHQHMKAVSPRDVTWIINSGIHSQELSFDRQLDYRYLVYMDGNAAMTHPRFYPHAQSYNQMKYHDGFRFIDHRARGEGFVEEVRFQNAAASLDLNLPSYIRASNGVRVEPMAHGGINGKGIWLDPNQHLEIDLPVQEFDYSQKDWFLGLYLDDRPLLTDQEQELFMFPDRSRILLVGNSRFKYVAQNGFTKTLNFNNRIWKRSEQFNHIGLQITESGRRLTFLVNGMKVGAINNRLSLVRLSSGSLHIGRSTHPDAIGLRGWIDDFIMMMGNPTPEFKCNEAGGFLAGLKDNSIYSRFSSLYPVSAHREISEILMNGGFDTHANYICYHNYMDRDGLPRGFQDSDKVERISDKIHFPEKDFKFNKPRPDSTENQFCLSCHRADRPHGLGLEALRVGSHPLSFDTRRQPDMHPMFMSGNLPKNFYGQNIPDKHLQLPASGIQVSDFYLWRP